MYNYFVCIYVGICIMPGAHGEDTIGSPGSGVYELL